MTNSAVWQVIRSGDADNVVLAVDFHAPGRAEAGFTDLAPLLAGDHPVWQTVQPKPATRHLEQWTEGILHSGREVTAIVGYCVGAVYATGLAARVAEIQDSVAALVLVDPEPATADGMLAEFHSVCERLAPLLNADELNELLGVAAGKDSTDLRGLGAMLAGTFDTAVRTAFERAGIDAYIGEELSVMFGSVISYIAGAAGFDGVWPPATVFSSTPANGWVPEGATTIDVSHAEILSSPVLARALDHLLTNGG